MSNKRIIYILCPGHSGSTLMEYYLSTYNKSIGIGEAYKAIRNFQNREIDKLSDYDQSMIETNPFWKEIHSRTGNFNSIEEQYVDMYHYILESEKFSDYQTIIDSSKTIDGLKILSKEFKDNLNVVIIYKDLRSWIISQIDNNRRKNRKMSLGYKYKSVLRWWRTYFFYHKRLKELGINYIDVSYDLFCLDQTKMELYLKENLDLEGKPDFQNTNSINILGNRMKKEANSGLKISYDYRWMHRSEWNFMWLLVPSKIKKMNRDKVWNIDH
ncbi:hypothetical protein [Rhodohalobacter sulfatireducens]|uniref:Sulfotransferase family protein n=1 Tax=Rhodohalobacter sulfatireducens TaxID=2911366 RepID=A0ABS9KIK4_9BACT|nr:hypothetical protein [Rhodohalobacter sulfatireducens]MCG2590670.1 hypothetical protein [Rhodohalobacter sulfatireducens]